MAPTVPVYSLDLGFTEPNLRTGNPADWTRFLITPDGSAPAGTVGFEHGRLTLRIVGGTGLQSNRREVFQLPGTTPWPFWNLRSRWASPPPADGIMEHGHFLNIHLGADGLYRSIVVWHFIPGFFNCGIWEWNPNGSGVGFTASGAALEELDTVTDASRTAGVVTAMVAAGAQSRWRPLDPIQVDLVDATYDGGFVIDSVPTDTTVRWLQAGVADDPSSGTGTIRLQDQAAGGIEGTTSFLLTDAVRTNGFVTTTGMPLGHDIQLGDWIQVDAPDNTYDGRFRVTAINPFTAQMTWAQPGVADDLSAGAATITKRWPHFTECRVLPGGFVQARAWGDFGRAVYLGGQGGGPMNQAPPPWEAQGSNTWDFSSMSAVNQAAAQTPGVPAVLYAHGSTNSWAVYDNIAAVKLAFP